MDVISVRVAKLMFIAFGAQIQISVKVEVMKQKEKSYEINLQLR